MVADAVAFLVYAVGAVAFVVLCAAAILLVGRVLGELIFPLEDDDHAS